MRDLADGHHKVAVAVAVHKATADNENILLHPLILAECLVAPAILGDIDDSAIKLRAASRSSTSTSETTNGVSISASFNDADQLTSRAGITFSYDANGNQLGSSAGAPLAYNGADQTTSLQSPSGSPLPATYAGANQFERISAGPTSFTNTALGVTGSTVVCAGHHRHHPRPRKNAGRPSQRI